MPAGVGGGSAGYASSSGPASTDSELPSSEVGGSLSFGAYVDDATAAAAATAATAEREGRGMGLVSGFVLGGMDEGLAGIGGVVVAPQPPPPVVPMASAVVEDELSKLLERLNMAKFRPKFDSKQVCVSMFLCVGGFWRRGVAASKGFIRRLLFGGVAGAGATEAEGLLSTFVLTQKISPYLGHAK